MVMTALRNQPESGALPTSIQTSLFGAGPAQCTQIVAEPVCLDESSSIIFQPAWLQGSDEVFDQLRAELPWRAMQRPMYDRVVAVPRLICTVTTDALQPSHPLATITSALENALHTRFSSIGANFYRTAEDSVAWHRDSIRKTRRPSLVALVSLGSPRTFTVRPHSSHPSKTAETTGITPATAHRWQLGHGDLLVMTGRCQHDWEHSVPKARSSGPRISLAFRSP